MTQHLNQRSFQINFGLQHQATSVPARKTAWLTCALLAAALAACQPTRESRIQSLMEPASRAMIPSMHPDIQAEFNSNFITTIVRGTSASAIAQVCPAHMRVKPVYRESLRLVLRSNDIEFRPGESQRDIAKKVQQQREIGNCASLAERLNQPAGYPNIFLERLR